MFINDIAVQPDGKIIAAGAGNYNSANSAEKPYMAVARYTADGSLDNSFAQGGQAKIHCSQYSQANSVVLQNNGKIVMGGFAGIDKYELAIARLLANGIIDSAFGTNGTTLTDIDNSNSNEIGDLFLQSDGKIIAGGSTVNINYVNNTVLARYYGDPVKQANPIVKKIKRWIRNHTLNWQYNADVDYFVIEQSSNGVYDFKQLAKVKASEQRTMNNEQYVYTYNLIANSRQLKANSKTYYRITAISNNNNKVVSDVICDEDVISITVSPNPVKDVLKISGLPVNQKATISIVDRNRNMLQSVVCNSSIYNMNVSGLHSGLYTVQVNVNRRLRSVKFVKE